MSRRIRQASAQSMSGAPRTESFGDVTEAVSSWLQICLILLIPEVAGLTYAGLTRTKTGSIPKIRGPERA